MMDVLLQLVALGSPGKEQRGRERSKRLRSAVIGSCLKSSIDPQLSPPQPLSSPFRPPPLPRCHSNKHGGEWHAVISAD